MVLMIIYLIGGFVGLYFGAEWLVSGSAALASRTGIRPVVIAITIVAFGTSAPEFVVSMNAAIQNNPDIVIGNIVGSIIANTALILGLAALVKPMEIEFRLIKKEFPILVASILAYVIMSWNFYLGRMEGIILLAGFAVFNWYCIKEAMRNVRDEKSRVEREYDDYVGRKTRSKFANIVFIVLGLAVLIAGSHFAIEGAVSVANMLGISPLIIAASLVAVGTSLPELATSVMAAARGESDISVGNIIGSNIFNILMCIGMACFIRPLTLNPHFVKQDGLILIGVTLVSGLFMLTRRAVGRIEGIILLLIYGAYLFYLFG